MYMFIVYKKSSRDAPNYDAPVQGPGYQAGLRLNATCGPKTGYHQMQNRSAKMPVYAISQ